MNERDLTGAMQTGLSDRVIRFVLIGRLDIATDPVTAWTGPGIFAPSSTGDTALDGQIFVAMAPFAGLTNILEDQGIGGPVTLALTAHDLDFDVLQQIVQDKREWRGRKAWLWAGLLDEDEKTVISNPMRIKSGIMVDITIERNLDESIAYITIDKDLGNAKSAAFRWLDHQALYPSDTFSSFIIQLANKPQGIDTFHKTGGRGRDNRRPGPGRARPYG